MWFGKIGINPMINQTVMLYLMIAFSTPPEKPDLSIAG